MSRAETPGQNNRRKCVKQNQGLKAGYGKVLRVAGNKGRQWNKLNTKKIQKLNDVRK